MGVTDLPAQLADLKNRTVKAGLIKTISRESHIIYAIPVAMDDDDEGDE